MNMTMEEAEARLTEMEREVWPGPPARADSGHIWLGHATGEVGKALFGDEWTGGEGFAMLTPMASPAMLKPLPRKAPLPPPAPSLTSPDSMWATREADRRRYESELEEYNRPEAVEAHAAAENERIKLLLEGEKRRSAGRARFRAVMDWIAQRAADEVLVTKARSADGWLWSIPSYIWNVDALWDERFIGCSAVHAGQQQALFFTRESLNGCLKTIAAEKQSGRRSLAEDDAPLIEEMRRLILAGEASSVPDAALAFADRAGGKGTAQSRAKRLERRYGEKYGGN